ncbi:MAG: serine hydroxymethyltransferase [Candidatus Buchananbacteria bacterium RBG_13_39_9]|uniref:Serine hydroxymethyltransferase n=1 Tax=Candidatus Buchananbacteria bacterium RBG_13_39_9 TaxID=1797531 RepID=A0A1G1XM17_9BACT|nr:MAG: serine hydroxymethyltransferase [Candidatus Buchananbacteria bacterium RBG_13_39_9]
MKFLSKEDPKIFELIKEETLRQQSGLIMIPSENFASPAVLEAMATPLNNKYAEGYPNARYYTGNQFIDQIESLAISRAKELFKADHVNVQPHSGTGANLAVYFGLLKPGDKIMSLSLPHGGHLSHGSKVSLVGQTYNIIHYAVDQKTELIDMDQVRELALKEKPQLIITGSTAYPRQFDFQAFSQISQEVGAIQLADVSHIVGLCLAGLHPDPVAFADVVTTTTHKTLRGPRSAIILCKEKYASQIDKAVFPGIQGGPFEHVIAAKAVCFKEAMTEHYLNDQKQTVKNAQALAQVFLSNGLRLVSGGTDTHLILIDCTNLNITGKQAANTLAECDIYANFNTIPFETRSPFDPSGLRIGTPALTTQGMKEKEMELIGQAICDVLKNSMNANMKAKAKSLVKGLTQKFPIYSDLKF